MADDADIIEVLSSSDEGETMLDDEGDMDLYHDGAGAAMAVEEPTFPPDWWSATGGSDIDDSPINRSLAERNAPFAIGSTGRKYANARAGNPEFQTTFGFQDDNAPEKMVPVEIGGRDRKLMTKLEAMFLKLQGGKQGEYIGVWFNELRAYVQFLVVPGSRDDDLVVDVKVNNGHMMTFTYNGTVLKFYDIFKRDSQPVMYSATTRADLVWGGRSVSWDGWMPTAHALIVFIDELFSPEDPTIQTDIEIDLPRSIPFGRLNLPLGGKEANGRQWDAGTSIYAPFCWIERVTAIKLGMTLAGVIRNTDGNPRVRTFERFLEKPDAVSMQRDVQILKSYGMGPDHPQIHTLYDVVELNRLWRVLRLLVDMRRRS